MSYYSQPITCARCGCSSIARDPSTTLCRPCGWIVGGETARRRNREKLLAMLAAAVPDACLEWPGNRNVNGYGVAVINRKATGAHRAAFELVRGPIPDGLQVLHRCDNPPCWNPHHLFLGTAQDNVMDSIVKGRWNSPEGERHGGAKLSEADVLAIRASRERQIDSAARYGVVQPIISAIKLRKIWKHVP